jgi:beta-glucosidase
MSTETRFPPGFVWGVATSAYQVEGAVREGGRGPSIWDTFSRVPGRVVGGDTGDVAADHYHRYREDAALMADLGVRAYRFSVAWPRVQPRGRGPANPEGLDFYRRLVDGLLEQGIEPWVTLYHWDLPQALQDAGGWANREVAGRFVEYAAVVYEALRDRVVNWTTLNEPWCAAFLGHAAGVHAPGLQDPATALRATHHLLLAHGQAVRALRSLAGGPRLGINLNLDPVIPASAEPADLEAARRIDGRYNRLFLDPLLFGRYPDDVLEELDGLGGLDRVDPGELETIAVPLDLLGVNYYRPFTVAARPQRPRFGGPPSPWVGAGDVEFVARGLPRTALGWEIDASGLDEVLLRLHRDYPRIPLFVTENGAAFEDGVDAQGRVRDDARVRFLDEHLRAAHRAIAGGVDLRGFFVWSLLDNFEWAEGYSKRFGIVYVDFPTQRRVAKDSARWYQDAIARGGLDGRPPGPAEDASGVRAAGRTPPADPAGNPPEPRTPGG